MPVRRVSVLLLLLTSPLLAEEPIQLRAGRLSMTFEPDNAFVRYVHVGEHKILQGISAPVRDRFWGTVPPKVQNVRVQRNPDSFTLTFDVSCRQGDIDFEWQGRISGNSKGDATFSFDGQAHSQFLRNRIGFCILHGPEAAGKPCVVESVDGKATKGHFPEFISPHQPFKNIRSIAHEVTAGVWAKVRMEGDTFEMEDQRNWTDASFKTYCTPLEVPYPVLVSKGTKVTQRIVLSVEGIDKLPDTAPSAADRVTLRVATAGKTPVPPIGLRVSSQTDELSESEIARLQELKLDHLRVDLTPAEPTAPAKLQRAANQAKQLGVALHVALHLQKNAEAELKSLTKALSSVPAPSTWLLISSDDQQVQIARQFLDRAGQKGRLGRGEDTNFTELNRKRPETGRIDVVSYGLNPQIHAFDELSIIETLAIQSDTVRSARQFTGKLPLLISPITLKKQAIDEPPAPGQLPSNVDPRQMTPFAAGWTLGSIKYLAEAGADSLTYYETVGWLGVMESERGSSLPQRFSSRPGQPYPIFHVLRELGPFAGGQVRETTSSDPMSVIALAVQKGDQRRLLLANLTPVNQMAGVQGFSKKAAVRRLGSNLRTTVDSTVRQGGDDEIVVPLSAYGIAILEPQ